MKLRLVATINHEAGVVDWTKTKIKSIKDLISSGILEKIKALRTKFEQLKLSDEDKEIIKQKGLKYLKDKFGISEEDINRKLSEKTAAADVSTEDDKELNAYIKREIFADRALWFLVMLAGILSIVWAASGVVDPDINPRLVEKLQGLPVGTLELPAIPLGFLGMICKFVLGIGLANYGEKKMTSWQRKYSLINPDADNFASIYRLIECGHDSYGKEIKVFEVRHKVSNTWGLVNKEGEEIVPPKYDIIEDQLDISNVGYHNSMSGIYFRKGFAAVKLNGKYGFLKLLSTSETAKEIVKPKYDDVGRNLRKRPELYARYFENGFVPVKLNDKWGFINTQGEEVVPPKYDYVVDFYDFAKGFSKVKLNDKYGFINTQGKEVVPPKYDEVDDFFHDGLAKVKLNGKWGVVNTKGEEVVPLKYNSSDQAYEAILRELKGK